MEKTRNHHTEKYLVKSGLPTQGGNFKIFLPLRSYVKSKFSYFKESKTAVLTIFLPLNIEFIGIFDIFNCKISKNQDSKLPKFLIKWQFLPSEINQI